MRQVNYLREKIAIPGGGFILAVHPAIELERFAGMGTLLVVTPPPAPVRQPSVYVITGHERGFREEHAVGDYWRVPLWYRALEAATRAFFPVVRAVACMAALVGLR